VPLEVTVHDPDFLMQQMQWREELEDCRTKPTSTASRVQEAPEGAQDS
jgi:molecular chaperone HscB